jgi:hypothetical protein
VRWILLDLVIALVALAVLAVLVRRLWRAVKALSGAVATAGDTIAAASDALAAAQAEGPLGGAPAAARTPGLDPRYDRAMPAGPASGTRQDRPRAPSGA